MADFVNSMTLNNGAVQAVTGGSFSVSLVYAAGQAALVNDVLAPGNSYYYGTNAVGTKGWYATSLTVGEPVVGALNTFTTGTAYFLMGQAGALGGPVGYSVQHDCGSGRLYVYPQVKQAGFQIASVGAGNANGDYWEYRIAVGSSAFGAWGASSSNYTTGGLAPWIGNSMMYCEFPSEFRFGLNGGPAAPLMAMTSGLIVANSNFNINGVLNCGLAAFAGTGQYLNTNVLNAASTTLLNSGVVVYNTANHPYGMDLGYVAATALYQLRLFAPDTQNISLSFYTSGAGKPNAQSDFTAALMVSPALTDHTGRVRTLDSPFVSPTTGTGLEIFYNAPTGYIISYDRTNSLYKPLDMSNISQTTLGANGAAKLVISSTGLSETMGVGVGRMTSAGVADVQTSASGVGNLADLTDDTLFTYSLPANSFNAAQKGTRTVAVFHMAATGNTKQVKFWVGGTMVADSGAIVVSNGDGKITIDVIEIDATHLSVTTTISLSLYNPIELHTPNLVVADATANATIFKLTGASTASGVANDVLGYSMRTIFMS